MPGKGSGSRCAEVTISVVTAATVCDVDLGMVWKVGTKGEDEEWAKVLAEIDNGGDWQVFEVLGAENDDFAFGYEEGDFIFCFRREAAQLDSRDGGACGGCQVLDAGTSFEIGEGWIGVFGMVVVIEWFERGILVVRSPAGEVLWVLFLWINGVQTRGRVVPTLGGGKRPLSSRPAIL